MTHPTLPLPTSGRATPTSRPLGWALSGAPVSRPGIWSFQKVKCEGLGVPSTLGVRPAWERICSRVTGPGEKLLNSLSLGFLTCIGSKKGQCTSKPLKKCQLLSSRCTALACLRGLVRLCSCHFTSTLATLKSLLGKIGDTRATVVMGVHPQAADCLPPRTSF